VTVPKSKHRKKPAAATAPAQPIDNQRRILFAIPTYSGKIAMNAQTAISRASIEAQAKGWLTDMTVRSQDSIISRARNVLASIFYQSNATDLLFWDADVACSPGDFTRLMSHDVDLVGGVYPTRGEVNGEPEFVVKPLAGQLIIEPNGLAQVEGVATGFLRITKQCMKKMVDAHDNRWFQDQTAPGVKIYSLFEFEFDVIGRQMFSEDYIFCRRWREQGGIAWADCELMMHHMGEKMFSGRLGDYLRQNYKAKTLAANPATLGPARIAAMTKETLAEFKL
jgi:hypothetical protein